MERIHIIESTVAIFREMMAGCVQGAVKNVLKELFELAEKAANNQQEQLLYDDYRRLQAHTQSLTTHVDSFTQKMPDSIFSELQKTEQDGSLSLIDEEDLELSLIFTQLDTVLEVTTHAQLYNLEKRLKVIYASRKIDKSNMPFSPSSISWIISHAFDSVDLSSDVKVRLVEKITKLLTKDLNGGYERINQILIDAGILPNIKPEALRREGNDEEQEVISADTENVKNGIEPNTFHEEKPNLSVVDGSQEYADSQQLVKSLFDMLSSGYQYRETKISDAGSRNLINDDVMDGALHELARQTTVDASSQHIEQFKEQISHEIRNKTGIYYPEFSSRQTKSMDVMGLVYDEIRKDSNIDSHIVSSLNAINIPLLRLAMNDDTFFSDEKHPARRYLETLITASQQWHGSPVVKKIHQYSEAVSRQFDGTTKSFENAISSLQDYLNITANRVKKAEEKWISAAKGQEKLEQTKKTVHDRLQELYVNTEIDFIKDLLKNVWEDSLTLTALRQGVGSDIWDMKMNAAQTLVDFADKSNYVKLSSAMKINAVRQVDVTMDEMGFSKRDRDKARENLLSIAEWAEGSDQAKLPVVKKILSIEKAKEERSFKSENKKIEEIRDLTDNERASLAKIKLKPYGSLFDFYVNQQGEKKRQKLCWISTMSERALFLDLLGKNPNKIGLSRLVIDLSRGNITEVEVNKGGYFQNTLKKILERLKSSSNIHALRDKRVDDR